MNIFRDCDRFLAISASVLPYVQDHVYSSLHERIHGALNDFFKLNNSFRKSTFIIFEIAKED